MKKMILGLMIMIMMLATVSAVGLRTNLANPVEIYRNLTISEEVSGSIRGANKNEFPITVTIVVPENKTISFTTTSVDLQPEDTFTFEYTKVVESSETINVGVKYSTTFEEADPKEFNLGSSLTFLVGSDTEVPKEENPEEVIEPVENETTTPEPTTTSGSGSSTTKKKKSSGGSSGGSGYDRPVVLDEPEVNLTEPAVPLNETDVVINITETLNELNKTPIVIAPANTEGTVMPVSEDKEDDKKKVDGYLALTIKMLGGLLLLVLIWALVKSISKGGEVEKMPEEQKEE